MWYKYFDKETWEVRLFRHQNLLYNQDDLGMFRNKFILRWKDFFFRMARSEANIRGGMFWIVTGQISIALYLKSTYYDPAYVIPAQEKAAKDLEEKDAYARTVLFYNKFGAPTRPLRSLDDMIAFLGGSKTIDELADFVSYDTAMDNNGDMQKGLDSWMDDRDKDMLRQYQLHAKGGGH